MNLRHTISRRSSISTLVGLLLTFFSAASTVLSTGEPDLMFKGTLMTVGTGQVFKSVIQPDGKIVITGDFDVAVTAGRKNIARLNPDGSLDTTFNPPAIIASDGAPAIRSIVLQTDGKIVIGGIFPRGIRRLNVDGSDDTAFNNQSFFNNQDDVQTLDLLPDGRIIYAGFRRSPFRRNLTILGSDGSVISDESSFGVFRIVVQPDGKIIIHDVNVNALRRLNQDLTTDDGFTQVVIGGFSSNNVQSIALQPDGKIVVGGPFTTINGGQLSGVARINPDGTVDTTFNIFNTANVSAYALAYLADGKILAAGTSLLVRLNTNGTRDTSFLAPTGFSLVSDLDVQTDGRIIVSCQTTNLANVPSQVIRLSTNGSLDPSFFGPVGRSGSGVKVRVLPDDKIIAGGDFTHAGGLPRSYLARFNADGTIDPTFNQTTITGAPLNFEVFADGKIVVIRFAATFRLNTDGTQDTSWNDTGGGPAYDILPLADGKILVSRSNGALQRLTANGSLESTFTVVSSGGIINRIAVQPDNKILIGGTFATISGNRINLARLNANGSVDLTFNLVGGTNGQINDIDLQTDGKIVVAGAFTSIGFVVRTGLARLNTDGSLDPGFAPVISSPVYSTKIMSDGKFLIGGPFFSVDGVPRLGYARLFPEGGQDGGFTVGSGANGAVNSLDTQSNGKIIMVGNFNLVNGFAASAIVRVTNGASVNKTFCDYDGDGRSDISVFRPSNGAWYLQRSHAGFSGMLWGLSTDRITPGDYDGDGKTDIAVYRPSNGVWYVFNSGNGTVSYHVFGIAEDLPTPADYDGDGKTDISVFRPSMGNWYRQNSSNGSFFGTHFGVSSDKPTLGDFDGDGKADIAVFRPSTRVWYRVNSSNGSFFEEQFGDNGDLHVAADYDADGRTDLAVFRPSNGNWIFKRSATSEVVAYPFGISTDIPSPADFDGDGKADPTVFRSSTGSWYRANSLTSSIFGVRFGINGDKPTQSAFRY